MPDKKNKLRVIIDTNLLISASIVPQSLPHQLINSWLKNAFTLLISFEQLEEIRDVSQRKKLKTYPLLTKRITELIDNIEFVAEIVKPSPKKDLPLHARDPKDDFLLADAFAAKADYLITGDKDLLILNGDSALGKLKIILVKDFM